MMSAGKTPDSSTWGLWQSYQQRHLGASRRNERRSENFAYQYLRYVNGSSTCHKILRHGASGFTFHLKEGVPLKCIASAGFQPVTLGFGGKDTNHYTTEATILFILISVSYSECAVNTFVAEQTSTMLNRETVAGVGGLHLLTVTICSLLRVTFTFLNHRPSH
jgi:hypothetical protein